VTINPRYERPARPSRVARDAVAWLGAWSYGYDAALGVRISRDPLAEQGGLNLYGFVQNSPLNLLDPLGHSWGSIATNFAIGLAVGVVTAAVIVVAAPAIAAVATGALVAAGVAEATAAAVVTGGAAVAAIAGTGVAAANTTADVINATQTGNWDQVAYDAGNILGAAAVVGAVWNANGGDSAVGKFDSDFGGRVKSGEITPAENFTNWLATMPTEESAALAVIGAPETGPD